MKPTRKSVFVFGEGCLGSAQLAALPGSAPEKAAEALEGSRPWTDEDPGRERAVDTSVRRCDPSCITERLGSLPGRSVVAMARSRELAHHANERRELARQKRRRMLDKRTLAMLEQRIGTK